MIPPEVAPVPFTAALSRHSGVALGIYIHRQVWLYATAGRLSANGANLEEDIGIGNGERWSRNGIGKSSRHSILRWLRESAVHQALEVIAWLLFPEASISIKLRPRNEFARPSSRPPSAGAIVLARVSFEFPWTLHTRPRFNCEPFDSRFLPYARYKYGRRIKCLGSLPRSRFSTPASLRWYRFFEQNDTWFNFKLISNK